LQPSVGLCRVARGATSATARRRNFGDDPALVREEASNVRIQGCSAAGQRHRRGDGLAGLSQNADRATFEGIEEIAFEVKPDLIWGQCQSGRADLLVDSNTTSRRNECMRRRLSGFDPSEIPPVSVAAEEAAAMREARRRLADNVAAKEAADKLVPLDVDWERRLAAARAAIAPSEPVAYRFVPRQGGFAITAITEGDLAVPVSPKTPLKWPKM
jgi:hypothetical protein